MSRRYMDRGHLSNILLALTANELTDSRIVGYVSNQQTAIVDYKNTWFCIWDNSGEIGVEKVNGDEPRFTPMAIYDKPLNALTMGYRLKQMIEGKEIDYDFEHRDEESEIFLKCFNREEKMYEYFSMKDCEVNYEEDDEEEM